MKIVIFKSGPIFVVFLLFAACGCGSADAPPATSSSAASVTFAVPFPRATDVSTNTAFSVTFTDSVDSRTVDTSSFLVSGVTGTVSYDSTNRTAIFRPTTVLPINTSFTVTLTSAIKNAGKTSITPFSYTFTTGATPDTTGPKGTSVSPLNNAVNVGVNGAITKTFSEPLDPTTVTDSAFTIAGVAAKVTFIGATAILTPTAPLAVNTRFIATVATTVRGMSADSFAGTETWAFTTGAIADRTRPSVESSVPAPCETAAVGAITIVFSEEMNPATVTTATFLVSGVTGTVFASGRQATFYPVTPLSLSTPYTVTVTTGAKDLAGNSLLSDYVFSFATPAAADAIAPSITRAVPDTGSTLVKINRGIHVTFSEPMDPFTVNSATFQVSGETGFVMYDPVTRIASFTPLGNLRSTTLESVTITRGVRDLSGNALAANFKFTLTTDSRTDSSPPNLGAAGGFGVLGGTAVSATGTASTISGDLGVFPSTLMTGFFGTTTNEGPSAVNGTIFQSVTVAANAQTDLTNAYNDVVARSFDTALTGINLAGLTLTPGVFRDTGSIALSNGVLTLDAAGNAGALFVFQTTGSLTTSGASKVLLVNGAQPSQVFWQVAGSATLSSGTKFLGSILSLNSITMNSSSLSRGRALASTGSVTMTDSTTVVRP